MTPVTSGILLVDKPQQITSHGVVGRVRRLAGTRKVGHAGTLDPMATGLLVIGIGASTRLLHHMVGLDKRYEATIRLGATTVTDDAEGEVVEVADAAAVDAVTRDAVDAGIRALTGAIEQVPSAVSAIKVDGRRAYDRVRAGEDVELAARAVTVHGFAVDAERRGDRWIDLDVTVDCSSGTYIRALARDLGAALGVGGHLTMLRRTRVGPFDVVDAVELADDTDVASALLAPAEAASRVLPRVDVDAGQATDLGHGKRVALDPGSRGPFAAVDPDGRLVAIVDRRGDTLAVVTGFPAEEAS
ncbi:tRNA pseudouridine(55) synthase TruB [Agromyces mangrovi Wang et al. 2018]|uniref:tRNA pseudouridine(55) synthase TruB n=1 Tax=Agromyces mangrovi TaxID=1858653 RepID=UPI002572CC2F|nr:tRNA pseudouridine(55) synthase TruB [Agromyces mangrovi]BDZ65987.1 tRNA pseudouridine synthase B [Agromyces mangrovi]